MAICVKINIMKEVENIAGNAYKVKITSVENVRKMRKILRKIYHYDKMGGWAIKGVVE